MIRNEISEYPYCGIIYRVTAGQGDEDDSKRIIYHGVMDEHMDTVESGNPMTTSRYIISIPMTYDELNNPIIPHRGDEIDLCVYDVQIHLVVDNSEPSQLGGVSIYATRNSW